MSIFYLQNYITSFESSVDPDQLASDEASYMIINVSIHTLNQF